MQNLEKFVPGPTANSMLKTWRLTCLYWWTIIWRNQKLEDCGRYKNIKGKHLFFSKFALNFSVSISFCRYDCKITELVKSNVKGTIFFGEDKASIENCSIHFTDEIMRIETSSLLTDRNTDEFPTDIFKRKFFKISLNFFHWRAYINKYFDNHYYWIDSGKIYT